MPLKKYSTIVWDWNGTLIDDVALCARLVTQTLAPRGIGPVSVEQYRAVYQHPIKNAYAALGAEMNDDEYSALTSDWLFLYERDRHECKLHLRVEEIIVALQLNKKRQVLLSAHRHDLVLAAVADFGLTAFFDRISGLESGGGHGKIETGQALLSELGLSPEEVLFVGDSFHDHEVALHLGSDCHLIAQGADARSKLEKSERPVFASLGEWSEYVGIF